MITINRIITEAILQLGLTPSYKNSYNKTTAIFNSAKTTNAMAMSLTVPDA